MPRPAERVGPAVAQVAAAVRAALELAGAADREATARLAELSAAAGAGWVSVPPGRRPAAGAGPAEVGRWWAGLTPAERRWLVAHEPALVGRLDGVPVTARDQANRLLLAARRAALLARERELLSRAPRGPVEVARLARVAAALRGLDGLAERLAAPAPPRAYLLGLDPAGDGRAIVALGNPDRAGAVLTYVPGMTADLADAPGELGRAARVLDRCAALAPAEETAAVLWLDYDAPDFLDEAARGGQARDAGPALHRFQEGLRASHEGPPARQTVLGHSYGSLVVGTAARDHGLSADALVFVGSPGVGRGARRRAADAGRAGVGEHRAGRRDPAGPTARRAGPPGGARRDAAGPGGGAAPPDRARAVVRARPERSGLRRPALPQRPVRPHRLLGPGQPRPGRDGPDRAGPVIRLGTALATSRRCGLPGCRIPPGRGPGMDHAWETAGPPGRGRRRGLRMPGGRSATRR